MKLKRLSLNQISNEDLDERRLCHILGGYDGCNCSQCGCYFEGQGGSAFSDNSSANEEEFPQCNCGDCTPEKILCLNNYCAHVIYC